MPKISSQYSESDEEMIIRVQRDEVTGLASRELSASEDGIFDPELIVCYGYLKALIDRFGLSQVKEHLKEIKNN